MAFNDGILVEHCDLDLRLCLYVSDVEFVEEGLLVYGFQQARAEFSVDLDRGTDHIMSESLDVVW